MTLGPDPVEFEARLDALGRAMETQAAAGPPAVFVGLVRRRRRAVAVRKAGAGVCGAVVLTVLVIAAQQKHPVSPEREVGAPTFASMRSVEDVDAVLMRSGLFTSPPMARAWERPDGVIGRQLSEFK